MTEIVVEKNANMFVLQSGKTLMARGKLLQEGIFVGDLVETNGEIIERVLPRKNLLIRPPLANVDTMICVVAPVPKPDFLLVDKVIVYCKKNGILPILAVNKIDIADFEFLEKIKKNYEKVLKIIEICAKNGNISNILDCINGITALCGQSAVGKSSVIKAITNAENIKIGELSKKVNRGKQTTRLVKLYSTGYGFLADTAGFSKLDAKLLNISQFELKNYYPEFEEAKGLCKFSSCNHITENFCGVKQSIGKTIFEQRYQNYIKIFEELATIKRYKEKL